MDLTKSLIKDYYIYKLNYYGVQIETLNWVSAFLNDRTQTIVLDGESSDLALVTWVSRKAHL